MSVSPPRGQRASLRRALFSLVAVAVAFAALLALADRLSDDDPPRLSPGTGVAAGESDEVVDPLAWDAGREGELVAAARRGFAHPLYTLVPGGAVASAARTARYRELVESVAEEGGVSADDLEALVYLESAGRPTAAADPRYEGAVGLTQIVARDRRGPAGDAGGPGAPRGRSPAGSGARRAAGTPRACARSRHAAASSTSGSTRPRRCAAPSPTSSSPASELGRDDLALAAYHAGVGNIQNVLKAYDGGDDVSYAQLYFDTSPVHNEAAYRKLADLGDDSATYLWRLGAAKEIMRLYREDRARAAPARGTPDGEELRRGGALAARLDEALRDGGAAARVVHGRHAAAAARRPAARRRACAIDPQMGELAPQRDLSRRLFRGLRPEALAVLVTLGAGVQEISRSTKPVAVTSTVRDQRYQDLLTGVNPQATREYSLHTTGYAFDILRRFAVRAPGGRVLVHAQRACRRWT